jgi:hypothetical protein
MITSLACSDAPDGRSRWTLEMLADKLVQLTELENVSTETVRRVLKKANSNRGKVSNGA